MVGLIKHGVRSLLSTGAFSRIVSRMEASADKRTNLLRVLTYHRIDRPESNQRLYPGTLSATPEEFAWQMRYLAKHCHVVDIQSVLACLREDGELPPKSVLVTFDDAYEDFAEHAWPVLQQLSLPALLFVPTAYPGERQRHFWWDRLHRAACDKQALATPADRKAFRSLISRVKHLPHKEAMDLVDDYCGDSNASSSENSTLTWAQLRMLKSQGLDLAAHTHTHPLLSRLHVDEAVEEIVRSRQELRRQLDVDTTVLAYPGGDFSDEVARSVGEVGFEAAFTTRRGVNELTTANPLTLRRINVSVRTPRALLRAQLLSTMRHFDAVWP